MKENVRRARLCICRDVLRDPLHRQLRARRFAHGLVRRAAAGGPHQGFSYRQRRRGRLLSH